METVIVTGGTGIIGTRLCEKLKEKGYDVGILSRSTIQETETKLYTWNYERREIDPEAIDVATYIIHLAGENLMHKKWTPKQKQIIVESRVKSGQLIFNKVKERKKNLKAFISASASGYYGTITSEKIFKETDHPADDFLGNTCRQWELMTDRFKDLGVRPVKIRTAPVLSKKNGVLEKILTPSKIGFASAIGTGKQYFPWIHIDDICGIYIAAIENEKMEGAYNAVAPEHKTNEEFLRAVAKTINKPFRSAHVPRFIVRMLWGEAGETILNGSRISSEKIRNAGYEFLFPRLEPALENLLADKIKIKT